MNQKLLKNDSISPERFALLNESARIFSLLKQDPQKITAKDVKMLLDYSNTFGWEIISKFSSIDEKNQAEIGNVLIEKGRGSVYAEYLKTGKNKNFPFKKEDIYNKGYYGF